ncbi:MAG: restriction endonuclease subunit S, partial [Candidatus Poribacteria bacterium]|nr:restriction endonuclease subunit S [Candidatus Poribacteria bacterium]
VLSSLDDKIDLLHRQNKTLEAMAQALFRKWFVVEPEGHWKAAPLDSIADYLNGLACQKFPPENETKKLPVLKIKELRGGFAEDPDWVTSTVDEKYIVHAGDVIFSWSGSLLLKIWPGQRCVLNQHLFKVTSDNYPKWFFFFWIKHHLNKFIKIADSKATTMGHIKRSDLSNSMVLIPDRQDIEKMNSRIEPEFEKIITNNAQIQNLENLREILLSKLMSGEVRIHHA